MREIVFDTETTGLDSGSDRIIEFGGIELVNRFPTGRSFHVYINPQGRRVHPDALAVHGIADDFLADKPPFPAIAEELADFLGDALLVAHNAPFDMGFVNAEMGRLGQAPIAVDRVIDTLALARRKHPAGPNSLDALCRRYGIDNTRRVKHGALLDSELLSEVYIELIGGRQAALVLDVEEVVVTGGVDLEPVAGRPALARERPLASRLSDAELTAHAEMVAGLGEKALWAPRRQG